jgi:small neutral amino acid transporter SnatA (MarC family)
MENNFFAYLSIVVGVFVCIGGGCAALFGLFGGGMAALGGLIALAIGIGMIMYGRSELKSSKENHSGQN